MLKAHNEPVEILQECKVMIQILTLGVTAYIKSQSRHTAAEITLYAGGWLITHSNINNMEILENAFIYHYKIGI